MLISLLVFSIILMSCSSDSESENQSRGTYVYNSKSDNRAMIFDFEKMQYWVQSKNESPDASGIDIGSGIISLCSNEDFLCMKSPFNFEVKKATSKKEISSKCKEEKFDSILNIKCNNSTEIRFVYSKERGVQRFSWDEYGENIEWECVSRYCLFGISR